MTNLIRFHEYQNQQEQFSVTIFPTDSLEVIRAKIAMISNPENPLFVKFPIESTLVTMISDRLSILNLDTLPVFQIKIGENGRIYFNPKLIRDIEKEFKMTKESHQTNKHELFFYLLLKLICSLSEIKNLSPLEKSKKKKTKLPSSAVRKRPPPRSLETLIESRPPPSATTTLLQQEPTTSTTSAPRPTTSAPRPNVGEMVSLKSKINYELILRYYSDTRLRLGLYLSCKIHTSLVLSNK